MSQRLRFPLFLAFGGFRKTLWTASSRRYDPLSVFSALAQKALNSLRVHRREVAEVLLNVELWP